MEPAHWWTRSNARKRHAITLAVAIASLVVAVEAPPAAAATCPSFAVPPAAASGGTVTDTTTADLDGDADVDVGAAHIGVNLVTALLNNGSADLSTRVDSPAGDAIDPLVHSGIAAGDLNRDGRQDLVVPKLWQNTVTTLRNTGGGSFTPHGTFPTGSRPFDVAVSDLDLDGNADVAVGNFLGSSVSLLFGDGSGGLADARTVQVGDFPTAVVAADLDVDGQPELLVTAAGKMTIVNRFAARNFQPRHIAFPEDLNAIAVGNFNGDLFPDAVVASGESPTAWVLTNTGKRVGDPVAPLTVGPAVATGSSYPARLSGLAVGDLDADNRADVAVLVSNANLLLPPGEPAVRVLKGGGDGSLTAVAPVVLGRDPAGLDVADLNADAAPDLVVGDGQSGVYVARSTCTLPAPLDITATGLEVVQVVQDAGNSVPLVEGKRTVVRGYARSNFNVLGASARLVRVDASGSPIGAPLLPVNVGGRIDLGPAPSRLRLDDGYLFDLPRDWTQGTLRLRLEVNPAAVPSEANRANNSVSTTVSFLPARTIKVTLVDYRWGICAPQDVVNTVTCRQGAPVARFTTPADPETFTGIEAELRRRLPVTAVRVRRQQFEDAQVVLPANLSPIPGSVELNRVISIRQGLQSAEPGTFFIWINANWPGGVAYLPSVNFPERGWDALVGSSAVAVHEVGHLLGRMHTRCSGTEAQVDEAYPYPGGKIGGPAADPERYLGFSMPDSDAGPLVRLVPPSAGDEMGYCQPRWPSDHTYRRWREAIDQRTQLTDPTGDFLVVGGTLSRDGSDATLDTAARVEQVATLSSPQPGGYRLRLTDASGAVLAEHPLTAAEVTSHEADARLAFNEVVDWAPGTRRVAVVTQAGTELAARSVSVGPPVVASVAHSGGGTLPASGPVTVTWSGSDPDGDPLTASVSYSDDGGASWSALATGLDAASYTVDAAALRGTHGGATGRFQVLLSDGVQTGVGRTGPFAVAGKDPSVRIAGPVPGARLELGQAIALDAVAGDPEDGSLDGNAISWSSSIDGALGTGRLVHARLTEGVHQLTVTATDTEGGSTSATVGVTVRRDLDRGDAPTANAGPDATGVEGATIALDGSASADPDGDRLVYSWEVAGAPVDNVPLRDADDPKATFDALDDGVYTFRLTVSDGLNPPVTDEVAVMVDNAAPTVAISAPAPDQFFRAGAVTLRSDFADRGALDHHDCSVDWDGDRPGFSEAGTVDDRARTCVATRTLGAGVYTIVVSVTDDDGGVGTATVRAVVYDPAAGSVAGAGTFTSPPGAYPTRPAARGPAVFAFDARYPRNASAPTGATAFVLAVAGMRFTSTTYRWLVVSGANAQYRGSGRVNGLPGYEFLLTARDAPLFSGRDRLRIRIWHSATGAPVYDNVPGAPDDLDSAAPQAIDVGAITIFR